MTQEQKQEIYFMRLKGVGYKAIANALGLSPHSVSGYCKRNHLQGSPEIVKLNAEELEANNVLCQHCKNPIRKKHTGRTSRFCSEACRRKWWNANRNQIRQSTTAIYEYVCACCGKKFTDYGVSTRKYCSRACYMKARFWREDDGISKAENRYAHSRFVQPAQKAQSG